MILISFDIVKIWFQARVFCFAIIIFFGCCWQSKFSYVWNYIVQLNSLCFKRVINKVCLIFHIVRFCLGIEFLYLSILFFIASFKSGLRQSDLFFHPQNKFLNGSYEKKFIGCSKLNDSNDFGISIKHLRLFVQEHHWHHLTLMK